MTRTLETSTRALLANVLDALDRLYDGETEVIDVQVLLQATASAVPESEFSSALSEASIELHSLLRAGIAGTAGQVQALSATDRLRRLLAGAMLE